jgi:hypothetical protein
MLADADLAALGRTLGDTHRARFVLALLGGQELTAGGLAARAGASSSLASRLLDLGWVRRAEATRAVLITPLGEQRLLEEFAVRV